MLHRLRSFLPSSNSSSSTSAYKPLTTVSDSALPTSSSKVSSLPTSSSPPTQYRFLKLFLGALLLLASYFSLSYLYSDPNAWPTSHSSSPSRAESINPLVTISDGRTYRGYPSTRGGSIEWKGIKYARAPVGELRFRRAQPLVALNESMGEEVIEAKEGDEGCARPVMSSTGVYVQGSYTGVEDCLSLNVYTPRKSTKGKKLLPVLVWIHGGGFYGGNPLEERYDPSDIMNKAQKMNRPLVFVSINYRLGPLGFTSQAPPPSTDKSVPPHIPIGPPEDLDLNVGFKDQLLALEWIRREISAFEGDEDKVTLLGHSAGAISVGLHQIYSPEELFRGAFMLSGAPTSFVSFYASAHSLSTLTNPRKLLSLPPSFTYSNSFPIPFPHDASYRVLHPLALPSSCPAPHHFPADSQPPLTSNLITCLRTLPLFDLMKITGEIFYGRVAIDAYFPWYPVLEGEWEGSWLNVRPSERIAKRKFARVPVVMGSTLDEGTRFVSKGMNSTDGLLSLLWGAFDFTYGAIYEILTPLLSSYPPIPSLGSPYETGDELFNLSLTYKQASSLIGDVMFQAPRRHFLRDTPRDWGEDGWGFLYKEKREGAEGRMGAQHGADIHSWFGHPEGRDEEAKSLSRHMTAYLINFVSNLDPNGPGLHHWPQYGTTRKMLNLARRNISTIHDDDRLDAMRLINRNNPLFAR